MILSSVLSNALFLWIFIFGIVDVVGVIVRDGIAGSTDYTPVLGRGYSASSNTMFSSCLRVSTTTEPTFDYVYTFSSVSSSTSSTTTSTERDQWSSAFRLFSVAATRTISDHVTSETDSTTRNKNYILAQMKVDLYYNALENSIIAEDSLEILDRGDYIGFVQACGPYYITSISRTKELISVFDYSSVSSSSKSFSEKLSQINNFIGSSPERETALDEVQKTSQVTSLKINIFGFGLSMRSSLVGTLTAKSMKEFEAVMDYGLETMKDTKTGIVRSVEVVPWAINPAFYIASKLDDSALSQLKIFNYMSNAEILVTIDGIVRKRFLTIEILSQCLGIIVKLSNENRQVLWVKNQRRQVPRNQYRTMNTAQTASLAITENDFNLPLSATRLLTLLEGDRCPNNSCVFCNSSNNPSGCVEENQRYEYQRKINNFLDYVVGFYSPCLEELGESNPDLGGIKLFSTHWTSMPSCNKPVCLLHGSVYRSGNCSPPEYFVNPDYNVFQDIEFLVDSYCMPVFV